MKRSWMFALALALPAAMTAVDARQDRQPSRPVIEGLGAVPVDARLVVSFRVAGALDEEILERIHSGIPVAFDHELQIVARRAVPLWTARVLVREQIHVQVTYDPLTRRYDLVRQRERRRGGRPEAPLPEERVTAASIAEVEEWMAAVTTEWPVEAWAAARADRLRLRVESKLGRRYVLLLFPGRITVQAECGIGP